MSPTLAIRGRIMFIGVGSEVLKAELPFVGGTK